MRLQEPLAAAEVATIFDALSQTTRLEAFRLLLRYHPFGLPAGDISRLLAVPHNTLSTHLAALQGCRLIKSRREGRSIIFAAIPARLASAQSFLTEGQSQRSARLRDQSSLNFPIKRPSEEMVGKVHNVLVLCTENSVRSVLAEAMINRESQGRFRAYSAGSKPRKQPNPLALELLSNLGYDTRLLRSKSWNEFAVPSAPRMDFIITVCDVAAGEPCPHWPGHPLSVHWGIPDPATIAGTPKQKLAAFQEAYRHLMNRTTAFVNLPIEQLSLTDLKVRIAEIGRMEGATELALSGRAA